MGKQIQLQRTCADEEALILAMQEKSPIEVVDSCYPSDWDRKTTVRSDDTANWVILDTRAKIGVEICITLATYLGRDDFMSIRDLEKSTKTYLPKPGMMWRNAIDWPAVGSGRIATRIPKAESLAG